MLSYIATLIIVLIAAVFDCKTKKIPNWLILAGLITGILMNIVYKATLTDIFVKIAVMVVILIFGSFRLLGMGDIKLWLVMTLLIGGIYSSVIICSGSILLIIYAIIKDKGEAFRTVFISAYDTVSNKRINKDIKEISSKGYPLAVFLIIPTVVITIVKILIMTGVL